MMLLLCSASSADSCHLGTCLDVHILCQEPHLERGPHKILASNELAVHGGLLSKLHRHSHPHTPAGSRNGEIILAEGLGAQGKV